MNYLSLYTMPSLKDITNDYVITEKEISTEGFSLKDAIQRFKDFILKIKNFVKNVIRKAIAGFKVIFHKLFGAHKQIEKIIEVVEPVDLIAVAKKVLVGDLGRTKFILNKDTSLINIDAFNKFADHIWDKIKDTKTVEDVDDLNIQPDDSNAVYGVERGTFHFRDGQVIENEDQITKITEKDLKELLSYSQIKRFSIDISEKGYPKQLNDNDNKLDEYLKTPDLTKEQIEYARAKCDAVFGLLRARVTVAHSLLGLYRGLYSELRKGSVFNTPAPQNMKLVHLSPNGELGDILYQDNRKVLENLKKQTVKFFLNAFRFHQPLKKPCMGFQWQPNSHRYVMDLKWSISLYMNLSSKKIP